MYSMLSSYDSLSDAASSACCTWLAVGASRAASARVYGRPRLRAVSALLSMTDLNSPENVFHDSRLPGDSLWVIWITFVLSLFTEVPRDADSVLAAMSGTPGRLD